MKILYFCLIFLILPITSYSQVSVDDIDALFNTPDETLNDEYSEGDEKSYTDSETTENENEEMTLDSLFETPDETIDNPVNDAEGDKEEDRVDVAALTKSDKPVVKGSLSVEGAIALGFLDWPYGLDDSYFSQLGAAFDGSAYYSMSPTFTIDVRPKSYFRFYTSISTALRRSTMSFGSPSFGELFLDYTFKDTYFFRVGKQSLTWGQGLLLNNIGNFVEDVEDGIAIKSFIPLGINGLTTLLYADGSSTSPLDFSYAALFDMSLGPLSLGFSGKFNRTRSQELITDLYLKTVIGEVDFAFETRGDFDLSFEENEYLWPTWQVLTNFYWENSELGIKFLGEYTYALGPNVTINTGWAEDDSILKSWAQYGKHRLGIGLLSTKPWIGKFKPGIRWYHDFSDTSGQFVIGLTGSFAPLITAEIGIPIVYGPDYGYYRLNNEDPENRVLSLIFQLTLESSYSF